MARAKLEHPLSTKCMSLNSLLLVCRESLSKTKHQLTVRPLETLCSLPTVPSICRVQPTTTQTVLRTQATSWQYQSMHLAKMHRFITYEDERCDECHLGPPLGWLCVCTNDNNNFRLRSEVGRLRIYLSGHYELLEDSVAPLRDAVAYVRDNPNMMDSSIMAIYEKVSLPGNTFQF
jgi:hypothetical protein